MSPRDKAREGAASAAPERDLRQREKGLAERVFAVIVVTLFVGAAMGLMHAPWWAAAAVFCAWIALALPWALLGGWR